MHTLLGTSRVIATAAWPATGHEEARVIGYADPGAIEAGRGPAPVERLASSGRRVVHFRNYRLHPAERELFRDGVPVEIGSRAFDLLLLLVDAGGQIVSKASIFAYVWPSLSVEESNLRFQMASLRKVLGNDRDVVKTIQGRGYVFVADWRVEDRGPVITTETRVALGTSPPPSEPESCVTEGSTRVAVIDDDHATREALEGFLRCSGLSPVCFPSVQAFRQRSPQIGAKCLVMDICMPGQTGLEFQAELVEAGFDVPIIFISGHADIHMSVRAMKAGAREFLTKPVRHEELLDAINAAVATPSVQLH